MGSRQGLLESSCEGGIGPLGFICHGVKPTGKKRLGRSRRRWEDNIRMYLKEICINTRKWVDSTQDWD